MQTELLEIPFDPWDALAQFETDHPGVTAECGAAALFIGRMRDQNEGDAVVEMFLEHYPEMTHAYLQQLSAEARARWPAREILLLHRVGRIQVGQTIVLVAVWSPHRAAALEACQYLIEALKYRAPFWKKEQLADGNERWVAANTGGPGQA